jgi:hypothetical protein
LTIERDAARRERDQLTVRVSRHESAIKDLDALWRAECGKNIATERDRDLALRRAKDAESLVARQQKRIQRLSRMLDEMHFLYGNPSAPKPGGMIRGRGRKVRAL